MKCYLQAIVFRSCKGFTEDPNVSFLLLKLASGHFMHDAPSIEVGPDQRITTEIDSHDATIFVPDSQVYAFRSILDCIPAVDRQQKKSFHRC